MAIQSQRQATRAPKIDVLIPAIQKDLPTLPYVIDSVRRHVRHPIGSIYIVSPENNSIRKLCTRKNVTFVNERTVLPIGKNDIHYESSRWNRSGWLYQQLLKMNGDHVAKAQHFLVIDADTVLIKPHSFLVGNRTAFYCRDWSQPEYFNTYRRLMRMKAPRPRSFVTHYMLFERSRLAALKKKIETIHRLPWYKAIIASIDKKKQFGFSEYETYANYMYTNHPEQMILKSSRNKSLAKSASSLSDQHIRTWARQYRSLSFHQRKIYSKAPRA